VFADVKSAKAAAMQAQVLGRVHKEIERQVLAVDVALRQIEDVLMFDLNALAEVSTTWVRVREHRDENLAVLDKMSMHVCHATDETSTSNCIHNTVVEEMVDALARLKTRHSEMEQMEAQMAAATPDRDWAARMGQMQKLRQQRVQRPRILCSHAVSNRTGQGLHTLQGALLALMSDTRLFAHVGAKVPLNYSMFERLAHQGRKELHQPSTPVFYRGDVKRAKLDANSRTICFDGVGVCTFRSRQQCPVGSKAYYEIEILSSLMLKDLWCGFAASAAFIPSLVPSGIGVGDDAVSWAVDGYGHVKTNFMEKEIHMRRWKPGDVIGLACDLQAMQMLVSINGSFAPPNGRIIDLAPDAVVSGLFSAFSCGTGAAGYNLGEAPFKYDPPAADYCAFDKIAMNQVDLHC